MTPVAIIEAEACMPFTGRGLVEPENKASCARGRNDITAESKKINLRFFQAALFCSGAAILSPGIAFAQSENAGPESDENVIVVESIRATLPNSMEVKRQSNVIVDALVSDEIGATPDQSVGYARTDEVAPEDFYAERSSVRSCNSVGGGNCSFSPTRTTPTYFVPNSVLWRQMNNQLTRDAVMGTIQYKPRPELDINIGGQFSRRKWVENRSDLVLAEGRRGITPTANGFLADGALLEWMANSRLESQTRIRQRDKDYYGGGFSADWTDNAARIGIDISYSATQRDAEYRTDSIFAVRLDGEAYIADGFLRSTQQTSEPII